MRHGLDTLKCRNISLFAGENLSTLQLKHKTSTDIASLHHHYYRKNTESMNETTTTKAK
jgi:hypothetical protein